MIWKKQIKRQNKGFTVAELLIVIAIIGILTAISIPVFTAQKKKSVIAANKANIRAARAAASAQLYGDSDTLNTYEHAAKGDIFYYVYNTKTGTIENRVLNGFEPGFSDPDYSDCYWRTVNEWGRVYSNMAKNGKICPKIIIYIGNPQTDDRKPDGSLTAPIQTAPYYNDHDEIGYQGGARENPFGPGNGASTGN